MPDEVNVNSEIEEKETGAMPTPEADTDGGKPDVNEDLSKQIAELNKKLAEQQKHIAELNQESAERRVKLKEYEEAEEQKRLENMSEIERAQAQAKTWEEKHNAAVAEWESKYAQLETQMQEYRVAQAVEMAAVEAGFAHPKDAAALVDLSAITIDDDGKITGFEEKLKELAKSGRLAMAGNNQELGTPSRDTKPKVQSKSQKRDEIYERVGRRFNL